MGTPIDRTAKTALDSNLVNGVTSDAPKVKANNDVLYNYADTLNGALDTHAGAAILPHADQSVTGPKIKDGAVGTTKIAPLAVTRPLIANGAVGSSQLDPALLTDFGDIAVQAEFDRRGVSVMKYGAVGDGVSDDTVAIQNAINNSGSSPIYFPPGTYLISDTITVGLRPGLTLFTEGFGKSSILMTGNNKPILKFTNQDTHSVVIRGLAFSYQTQQTSTDTESYCIMFTGSSNPNGFYFWNLRDVKFYGANVGIGIKNTSGPLPVWGSQFEDLYFSNMATGAIWLISAGAIGQPINIFRNIKIFNTSVVPNSYALRLRGEWLIEGLDVEKWQDRVLYADSGENCILRFVHIEWHNMVSANNMVFVLADGKYVVEGVSFTGVSTGPKIDTYLFNANSGTILQLKNAKGSFSTNTNASRIVAVTGDSPNIELQGLSTFNANYENFGNTWLGVRLENALIPTMPSGLSLPTASATYRGRMWRVNGAAGVADKLVMCMKSAADTYSWKDVVIG